MAAKIDGSRAREAGGRRRGIRGLGRWRRKGISGRKRFSLIIVDGGCYVKKNNLRNSGPPGRIVGVHPGRNFLTRAKTEGVGEVSGGRERNLLVAKGAWKRTGRGPAYKGLTGRKEGRLFGQRGF